MVLLPSRQKWYSEFDWFREISPCRDHPVLYPHFPKNDASPKTISERTSYYQIRLAFHSNPQVIRWSRTTNRFGPPPAFRRGSPCSWVAHLASGLISTTKFRAFTLAFASAPRGCRLARQYRSTRWLILQ